MNVSLTPELTKFIGDKVSSGLYRSASEVVREGLRLLRERDQLAALRLSELRKKIAVGLEQLDAGDVVDGESVFRELQERSASRRRPPHA